MEIFLQGMKRFKDSKIIEVCNKYIHPSYDDFLLLNDIAILKFCSPIKLTNEIHPISNFMKTTPKCNRNFQSKENTSHDKISYYMAGCTNSFSTLTNVVDLSLIELENAENQVIKAHNVFAQPGDSGYPLWWTNEDCNQLVYQVSKILL